MGELRGAREEHRTAREARGGPPPRIHYRGILIVRPNVKGGLARGTRTRLERGDEGDDKRGDHEDRHDGEEQLPRAQAAVLATGHLDCFVSGHVACEDITARSGCPAAGRGRTGWVGLYFPP